MLESRMLLATWTQLGNDIDGEAAVDLSGSSVAMSDDGNTVVVGGIGNDGNGDGAGHARVYRYDGSSWSQLGNDIDGEAAFDQSGYSAAMSDDGNTVVIGARFNDGNGTDAGHARVYHYDGSSWTQLGNDIDGEAAFDQSGGSVAISDDGDTVVIGAASNDGNGSGAGHARVYHYDGSSWAQLGNDIDGEATGDQSGFSVAMSDDGNTVVIGAILNDGHGSDAGHARVYNYDGSSWTQLGNDIDGEAAGDQSGYSVAMSDDGNTVVIGARDNNGNGSGNGSSFGHARVYHYGGGSWTQLGNDIDGEASSDLSGSSVAMSDDGNSVVIGAFGNDANGFSAGHVRVYHYDGSSWTQLGNDIDGEAASDRSGWSVAMSDDGNTVVIGAPFNAGNGSVAGHARVYRLSSPNVAPTANAGGSYSGNEGSAIPLSGTASDPDGDILTLNWSVDTSPTSATCTFSDASALNPDLTCDDNGTFAVTLTADDGTAAPVSSDATVTVNNVRPSVGAVSVPIDPIDINNMPVSGVSAPYTDPGTNDTHTCTVDYGDGTAPQTGTATGGICTDLDGHTYTAAGVYEVTAEVTDDDLDSDNGTATEFIVIYDAAGGFVSGGGWIDSPEGACPVFCDDATGKANFGFVSKYKKGASVPTGQTEFNFKAGDLDFHSSSYDWLVIAGKKAMYKGDGTVNGDTGFTFQINAIDGDLPGGDGIDKFRIKIKETGGGVIYDNQMGAGDNDDPSTALGGGSIKVHKPKASTAAIQPGDANPPSLLINQSFGPGGLLNDDRTDEAGCAPLRSETDEDAIHSVGAWMLSDTQAVDLALADLRTGKLAVEPLPDVWENDDLLRSLAENWTE